MSEIIEVSDEALEAMDKLKVPANLKQPIKKLSFITDENLYKEIIKYLDKTFPMQKSNLSQELKFEDSVMKGSNIYIAVGVDMFLKKQNLGYRIATQRDLETNLQRFRGFSEDTGLALRSLDGPNKSQAGHLYKQLKLKNPKIKFPIFIELKDLELDENLNFNLTNGSKYKIADCLNWENGEKYSKIDEFGLPEEINRGSKRKIFTNNSGLVKACIGRDLNFCTDYGDFLYPYNKGRVVLAKVGK
ncbi:MAG: hypothetical protein AABX44_00875 [Nanoarchaeota archaeon]